MASVLALACGWLFVRIAVKIYRIDRYRRDMDMQTG